MDIVLIQAPLTRPCEAPAGLARLAGALKARNRHAMFIDANMEGIMDILGSPVPADDTWTRRALLNSGKNLSSIRDGHAFRNMDAYTKAVSEISRVLEVASRPFKAQLSINNFQHDTLSPLRSSDLIHASGHPEENVFYASSRNRLTALLEGSEPDVAGFSLNYLSQALTTFAMIGMLKKMSPRVRIILGGGLVTSWMNRPGWTDPFTGLVDELVPGPGERRILSLAGVEDCGTPALPDYEPFRRYGYLSPAPVIPFSASTGCYWGKCSFCPEKAEGNPYSAAAAKDLPDALKTLTASNQPGLIHLIDNAVSPSMLKALAEKPPGAPWYGFARITHHLADRDFCHALKDSGCVMLQLGLESGDQAVLDELDKGIRLEEASQALHALNEAGIGTYVYLLFGTPAEDEQSARKTLDFTAAHAGFIDYLNISIFNLPKGCAEAENLQTYEFFDGDLSLYEGFIHPKGWDRNLVRQFLDKEFRRHPAIARIIRNDPPFFTSNHAPFFVMDPQVRHRM